MNLKIIFTTEEIEMENNEKLMPEKFISKLLITKKKIKAYEYNGSLSLDRTYLEELAGSAKEVREVQAEMNQATYQDLKDVSANAFDFAVYNQLRDDLENAEAEKYFEKNAKCLAIRSYDDIFLYFR